MAFSLDWNSVVSYETLEFVRYLTIFNHFIVRLPLKSLKVYDLGMKMYTSQPITALLGRKPELPLAESCNFHAKIVHVQVLYFVDGSQQESLEVGKRVIIAFCRQFLGFTDNY